MITQVSTTIDLNPELANLAYEMGLNAPKICENALKDAIRRLQGSNSDYASVPTRISPNIFQKREKD